MLFNLFKKKNEKKNPVEAHQRAALKAMEAEQALSELVNRMNGNNLLAKHIECNTTDLSIMRARIGR